MKDIKHVIETHRILRTLNTKAKYNIKKNIQAIGLSRQSFYNKFNEMKEQKIIKNFTININPNHPLNLKFVMLEIKTNPKEPHLVEELLEIPQLKMLDGIFGEFSLLALFIFKSSDEYHQVLSRIDNIMAKSYFKKYQIIEIIKVFKTSGVRLSDAALQLKRDLDKIDYLILKILQETRETKPLSTYKINQILKEEFQIDISQPTVYHRIKNLEYSGVILNYTVNFCPRRIGFKGKYIVRIKPKDPSKYNDLAMNLENIPEITDLFRIGEQYGLFAIVRVKKIEDYGLFIKNLYETEEIEDTFTNFVLDELKPYTNFVIE